MYGGSSYSFNQPQMKEYNQNIVALKHSKIQTADLKQKVFLMHKWDVIKNIKAQMLKQNLDIHS
jgi:hypothetical protein